MAKISVGEFGATSSGAGLGVSDPGRVPTTMAQEWEYERIESKRVGNKTDFYVWNKPIKEGDSLCVLVESHKEPPEFRVVKNTNYSYALAMADPKLTSSDLVNMGSVTRETWRDMMVTRINNVLRLAGGGYSIPLKNGIEIRRYRRR